MRLTIIGATGPMPGPASPVFCYLVQRPGLDPLAGEIRTWSIVLEMGPDSFGALWRHVDPRMTNAPVPSHTHADHMGGIISLQVFCHRGPGSDPEPLPLAGPVGTLEGVRQIDGTHLPDAYEGESDIRIVRAGQSYRIGSMTLTPLPGIHTVEPFGTHIVGLSGSSLSKTVLVLFTGDTDKAPAILGGVRGVNLLLTEVGFTRTDTTRGIHMDDVRTGRLVARAEVARLVATHIQPWTDLKVVGSELCEHWADPLDLAASQRVFIVGQ